MYSITAAQEQILLDLIKGKRPATWTDEEYDLIVASSRCNDWQDLHGELLDAISDYEYEQAEILKGERERNPRDAPSTLSDYNLYLIY